MRKVSLTLGILITSCALGLTGTAMAASADHALSTKLGNLTCAEFTQMNSQDQEQMVSEANMEAPGETMAKSPSPSNSNTDSQASNDGSMGSDTTADTSSTPLTAGALVAACQAATMTDTVQQAYQQSLGATAPSTK